MERISRGFRLARSSFTVLRGDTGLLLLPLLAFGVIAVSAAVYVGFLYAFGVLSRHMSPVAFVPLYFVVSFVSIFSSAAVVATADLYLQGRTPTLGDGIHVALGKIGSLAAWSVLTTTVGLVVRALEERAGIVGRFVVGLLGMAWSVATFMVVPVILFEEESVTGSVKRSATLFRQRWGEQLVGNGSIGLAVMVVGLVAMIPCALLFALSPIVGGLAIGLVFVALMVTSAALSGIFNAALYRYATTGAASGAFTAADLQGSFQTRRRGGPRGFVAGW
jgi:Family of unknown function (DUF6159)